MLRAAAFLMVALAGCGQLTSRETNDYGAAVECRVDEDCVATSSTCCGCADTALALNDPALSSCDGVECPMPSECAASVARCASGVCTLACAPVECDLACEGGYATDAMGCLLCACNAGAPPAECAVASDCVAVAADCCGCARGGVDVVIPTDQVDAWLSGLNCSGDEGCPEVDVCPADLAVDCVSGRCDWAVAGGGGAGPSCGDPSMPPCPPGTMCVLNSASDLDPDDGLGVCE